MWYGRHVPPTHFSDYWLCSQFSSVCTSMKNGEIISNYVLPGSTATMVFNSIWYVLSKCLWNWSNVFYSMYFFIILWVLWVRACVLLAFVSPAPHLILPCPCFFLPLWFFESMGSLLSILTAKSYSFFRDRRAVAKGGRIGKSGWVGLCCGDKHSPISSGWR